MPWPLSQDYNEAIQDPGHCFSDADLRAGQAVTNALGLPLPCSGNFADVYQVCSPADGRRWAVKCFTRQVPGLRERYAAVSTHLRQTRPRFAVDFQYLDQGIRVRGQCYPVLKMQWVEGQLLNEFVRGALDRPARLGALAEVWARLSRRLREADLAHGDLQHGNVLLVPDRNAASLHLRLIDYDGMWVPALAGQPSGEVGHPAYQHPQRPRESAYNAELDRFPLLLVYVAVRALMAGGRALWDRYDNGDNLLFRQQDLEAPSRSALFLELLKLDDPSLRFLVGAVIDAARKPLGETPLLEELLIGAQPAAPARRAAAPTPEAAPAAAVIPGAVPVATAPPPVRRVVAQPPSPGMPFAFDEPAPPGPGDPGYPQRTPGGGEVKGAMITGAWVAGAVALVAFLGGVGIYFATQTGVATTPGGTALAAGDAGRRGERRSTQAPAPSDDDAGRHGEPEFDNSVRMKFVLIPAGKFQMGSPPEEADRAGNENPRHVVEISRPFYMGVYPVTQEEYQAVTGTNPSYFSPGGAGKDKVAGLDTRRFPVEQVSWNDAVAFCEKLSGLEREKKAGRTYRLPTEAEWEYACRAGTTTRFSFGERISAKDANFDATQPYGGVNKEVSYGGGEEGPSLGRTAAVGSYPKNAFGLYDMHGNVYQWCNDWHDEDYYRNSPGKDPPGPGGGPSGERSMRGGNWGTPGWNCRAAARGRGVPNGGGNGVGFRVVCVIRDSLSLAALALSMADDAAESDDYPAAEDLVRIALVNSAQFADSPVSTAAEARLDEAAELRRAYEPLRDAVRTLAARPADPQANLALGKFYALTKGDWDRGLSLFARGSDRKLKALAEADLAIPRGADAAVELADRYKAQADSERGAAKTNLLCRACYWYQQAASTLAGAEQTKVATTIADINKALPPLRPVVLACRYGAYDRWADVTERVRLLALQHDAQRLTFRGDPGDLGILDPAPYQRKSVVAVYRYRGATYLSLTGEGETVSIPALPGSPDAKPGRPASGQELVVLCARYGHDNRYADATAKTQAAVHDATLAVKAQDFLDDPLPGQHKAFIVLCRDSGGRVRLSVTPENVPVTLEAVSARR
jgi:formylglycine-generating enzyme required for sulfatase activity